MKTDPIELLKEKLARLERQLARNGDAYLQKVCRADITYYRKQLQNLQSAQN